MTGVLQGDGGTAVCVRHGRGTGEAEEVRSAIARDLHDSVVQTMTTMLVQLEEWRRAERSEAIRARVLEQQSQVREALLGLRSVVHGLRPNGETDADLADAVRHALARLEGCTGIEARLVIAETWSEDMQASVRLHLLRIVEEALANAARHSGAARVEVRLLRMRDRIEIVVGDDGRGRERVGGPAAPGLGIRGMKERALLIGARLQLRSGSRHGTVVRVCLPLVASSAA